MHDVMDSLIHFAASSSFAEPIEPSVPQRVLAQHLFVADNDETPPRPSDGHVHPPRVLHKSEPAGVVASNGREDDAVCLAALEAVHGA